MPKEIIIKNVKDLRKTIRNECSSAKKTYGFNGYGIFGQIGIRWDGEMYFTYSIFNKEESAKLREIIGENDARIKNN